MIVRFIVEDDICLLKLEFVFIYDIYYYWLVFMVLVGIYYDLRGDRLLLIYLLILWFRMMIYM